MLKSFFSRSGQLSVTDLVTALEKVRTCMWETKIAGAQDCRMILKASQSCYTGILIELFMPDSQ